MTDLEKSEAVIFNDFLVTTYFNQSKPENMRKKALRMLTLLFVALLTMSAEPALAQGRGKAPNNAAATTRSIYRGTVVDDQNEPLPGVTVLLDGSKTVGTTTNENGKFQIALDNPKATFQFSYVGMKTKVVKLNPGKENTVMLENDSQTLQETVVNGIYTRNIESFTGQVSTFSGDQLKAIAPQGILKSLAILDPSVILTDNMEFGSDPNRLADISINGKMNVQALSQEYETDPNQPLFILDGFESDLRTITDLNMDRVESISVLKDASATAIYGSKAANGVIVVETVKPKAGKLRLSYNGSLQIGWADLSDFNMMNAAEKLEYELLSGVYGQLDSNGKPIDEIKRREYMSKMRLVKEGHDTYWLNEPLRTAITQNHNLYMDGGDQAFRYGAGLSYGKTEGVMKGSDREVINGNIQLNYRVDNFNFSNQTSINYSDYQNEVVPFSRYSQMNPFYDKRTEDGEIPKYVYQVDGGATIWNPLWDSVQNSYSKGNSVGITDNFQFEWRILQNLRLRGSAQYSMTKTSTEAFTSPNATTEASKAENKRGSWNKTENTNTRWSGRLNATYGVSFGVHTINAVAGAQVSQTTNRTDGYGVIGYLSDQFSNPNFSVGYPEGGKPNSVDNKTRNASFYGNFNYAYAMRYLLDFNLTSSGASQFGIDNPFTTTWSVGVGWNVSNESWFKNKVVSYLKINASYGNPGNQNYDAKLASSIYNYITNYTNPFGLAAIIDKWGNRGLEWQKTKTYNVGTTMTLFGNRWNLSGNYQVRRTEPQLVSINLPGSTGVTTAPMNVGGTDNRSWSASTTVYIIRKGELNWYVSGNVNHNTTKYMHIGHTLDQYNQAGKDEELGATATTGVRTNSSSLMRMYDGASTTGLYVVRSLGIDPATGNELFVRKDGTVTYEWNSDDEILWGDTNPKFTGSMSTSLTWKGFSVAASFTFRSGGDVYLSTLMDKVENIGESSREYNQDRRALTDRWKKPGDIARFKRIDDTTASHKTSRFIATEHTLQCSSISIGYRTVSWPFIRKAGLSSVDIRAYMNDIFRISNIKEERGYNYPFQRSVSMSLGLSF